ncbi:MAG TPA: hypothetical protein VHA53_02260, partial [Nitrolancea sp.]|nr:hypothetical protein [Nitrolancea sp.]
MAFSEGRIHDSQRVELNEQTVEPIESIDVLDNQTPSADESKVLVVAGMHRSGTSLTANWLAQCGLDVGQDLLAGLPDNPTGHFEDRSFVYLHIDMLADNGSDHLVTPGQQLTSREDHYRRAQELI